MPSVPYSLHVEMQWNMENNLFLILAGNRVVLWTQETEALVTSALSTVTAGAIIIPIRT